MAKGILFFVLLWSLVSTGIWVFTTMSGSDRWSVFRIVLWGAVTAAITGSIVFTTIVLF